MHWWIKADGCDLVEGLSESTSKIWSGDVDLADGEVQKDYEAYVERLAFVETVGLPPRSSRQEIADDLQFLKTNLEDDLEAVTKGTPTDF